MSFYIDFLIYVRVELKISKELLSQAFAKSIRNNWESKILNSNNYICFGRTAKKICSKSIKFFCSELDNV